MCCFADIVVWYQAIGIRWLSDLLCAIYKGASTVFIFCYDVDKCVSHSCILLLYSIVFEWFNFFSMVHFAMCTVELVKIDWFDTLSNCLVF